MTTRTSLLRSVFARRIYSLFVLCALLPICLLAAISLVQVSRASRTDGMERLRHSGKNAGMTIMEALFLLEVELRSVAQTIDRGTAEDARLLRSGQAVDDEKRFLAFSLFSEGGEGTSLLGSPISLPRLLPEARRHLRSGKALLFRSPSGRICLAVTLGDDRTGDRLLVAEVNPDYLWSLVRRSLSPETELCVVDASGRLLFTTAEKPPRFLPQVVNRLATSSVGQLEWSGGEQEQLVSYWTAFLEPRYLSSSWSAVVSQERQVAFRQLRLFGRTFLLVVCLALILVSYLSGILIRRNLLPLATLRQGTQRLSQGELEVRLDLRSGDEFQELAENFNTMADRLERQFFATRETGRVVQEFLAAHDRDTVVRVALSSRGTAVLCQAIALSLMGTDPERDARTYLSLAGDGDPAPGRGRPTPFSGEEIAHLVEARGGHLHCSEVSNFSSLLRPLAVQGAHDFYLFPFFLGETLTGVLSIGYSQLPVQIQGDLARARHVADETAVALDNLRLMEELNQLNWGTIGALATAVDAKSPWTAGHSERVTRLALDIGRTMGLDEQALALLHLGGLFHDIGKIAVPEAILDKRDKLTDEEFALIKSHPSAGARILAPISAYEPVIPVVEQHHEWFNGEGYPQGLAGHEISQGGRILAVADVFDALISDRPYRAGWEQERVVSHIVGRAWSQFDPVVVEALLEVVADRESAAGDTAGERPEEGRA